MCMSPGPKIDEIYEIKNSAYLRCLDIVMVTNTLNKNNVRQI